MDNFNIKINGQTISVPTDYTVLQAAEDMGINVPRLCFLKDINETSACRLCVVDVKGMRGLKNSCTLEVYDGMEIETDNQDIQDSIVENLKLLASNHVFECWACEREHNCELLDLMRRFNVENIYGESFSYDKKERMINDTSEAIVLDSGKCILCGRCVSTCDVKTGLGILQFNERGNETFVGPANFHPMEDSGCINCGKCIQACPTAAIKEKSHIDDVLAALKNPFKTVVAVPHPSVSVTLGEEFGSDIGTTVEGQLFTSLQRLGFNEIMDYNLANEFHVAEVAKDLVHRVNKSGVTPLYSSSAPGWLDYIEQYEPDQIPHLSTAKSAQQIAGLLVKHHFANELGYQRENVVVVAIGPGVDKKAEARRPDMMYAGVPDVDFVLTTKEYARLLKRKAIDFLRLPEQSPFGELAAATNVGSSFHNVNGTLEATLSAVSELLEAHPQELSFKSARGQKDIKEATYKLAGKDINVAIVQGGMTIAEFFGHMKKTKKSYHFVEFIEQDGSLIGGGEPIHSAIVEDRTPINQLRLDALANQQESRLEQRLTAVEQVKTLDALFQGDDNELSEEMLQATYEYRPFYK